MHRVLEVQRELWRRVAQTNRRLVTGGHPSLVDALSSFEQSFPARPSELTESALVEALAERRFVLVGDYHPLREAQLFATRLCGALRPDCVALEILPTSEQARLDAWSRGELPARALFEDLGFSKTWNDLDTTGYESLLEKARSLSCTLIACDHPGSPPLAAPSLEERDRHMARVLETRSHGRRLLLAGDLHLAPTAVPAHLRNAVCVHQNHAPYHFELQRSGRTPPVYLRLCESRYCHQEVHPLRVEESALHWLSDEEDPFVPRVEERFIELAQELASLVDSELPKTPVVLTLRGVRELEHWQIGPLAERRSEKVRLRLAIRGSAFLGKEGPLILLDRSSQGLGAAALQFLHLLRFGHAKPRSRRALRLGHEVALEAVGQLGASLVHPIPRSWVREFDSKRGDLDSESRDLAAFLETLLDASEGQRTRSRLPDPDGHRGLTLARQLGHALGRSLESRFLEDPESRSPMLRHTLRPPRTLAEIRDLLAPLLAGVELCA